MARRCWLPPERLPPDRSSARNEPKDASSARYASASMARAPHDAEARERRFALAPGDEIVANRGGQAQPFFAAIGADVADAGSPEARGRGSGQVAPAECDRPRDRRGEAGRAGDEFVLAIAADARDADDLAGEDVDIDRPEALKARLRPTPTRPRAENSGASAGTRPRLDSCAFRPARRPSRVASSERLVLAGVVVATTRPERMTVIASATLITSSSLWLMKTIVRPSAFSLRINAEQILDLLRGEHGGWLVQDQNVRAAIKEPQDLEDLADVDRSVGRLEPPVDRDAGERGSAIGFRLRFAPSRSARRTPTGSRARIKFSKSESGGASMNS